MLHFRLKVEKSKILSTVRKGDALEEAFFEYLVNQQDKGDLVFGLYPHRLCKIYKKKGYYCNVRERDIEFDIVIEFSRQNASKPHLFIIFECKNHSRAIQERDINDFSAKLGRVFGHAAKGFVISTSKLQSGAKKVAIDSGIGIAKYDEQGLDIVAERFGGLEVGSQHIKQQIFSNFNSTKPLNFSSYYDEKFAGSISELLEILDANNPLSIKQNSRNIPPFLTVDLIRKKVERILSVVEYNFGPVIIKKIISYLSLNIVFSDEKVVNVDGLPILGSANFEKQQITIHPHLNENMKRFTIGHEIGHFHLMHGKYLLTDSIIESDLFLGGEVEKISNIDRLEIQANIFASELLLPAKTFWPKVQEFRDRVGIQDRGHGYIFVDDQVCNSISFNQFLMFLSDYFNVSKKAIEVRLKNEKLLTDHRQNTSTW